MSAPKKSKTAHATAVRRGMELSKEHQDGLHTEFVADCARCKKEAKGAVPDVETVVTLKGGSKSEKSDAQKEKEHQAALKAAAQADKEAKQAIPAVAGAPGKPGGDAEGDILVHVLEDGFTVLGTVWYRGQEINIKKGSAYDKLSRDTLGNYWYDLTANEQIERYGKQVFANGPWPFDKADAAADEEAYMKALNSSDAEAIRQYEKKRQRSATVPVPSGSR